MAKEIGELNGAQVTSTALPRPLDKTQGRTLYDTQVQGLQSAKADLQQRIAKIDAGITELERRRDKYFPAGG